MSETDLVRKIILHHSTGDVRVFRNNVGVLQDIKGNHVRYGLAVGSHDLIGFKSITITPEMVGQRVARFVSIEAKTKKGYMTKEQMAWMRMVREAGGIAGEARSVEDATQLLAV